MSGEPRRQDRPSAGKPPAPGRRGLQATLALACALAERSIDYLGIFKPFVLEILRGHAGREPLDPSRIASQARRMFGIPWMPRHVVNAILRRLEEDGFVRCTHSGRIIANVEKLAEVPSLIVKQNECLRRMEALEAALIVFAARERNNERWTHGDANEALRQVVEEFGSDIALAAQGRLRLIDPFPGRSLLAVAYRFAAWAFHNDPESWRSLLEMVRGAMYLSVMYYSDVEGLQSRLTHLQVALDTPIVVRLLGLSAEPLEDAAWELLKLLEEVGARVFVFEHTADEIRGILERVSARLKRGTRWWRANRKAGLPDEEAVQAARAKDWKAKDVQAMRDKLEAHLADLGRSGVEVLKTPPHVADGHLDEERLEGLLQAFVKNQSADARGKDLLSLTAIDRMRGEITGQHLEHTIAVVVTSNCNLAHASRAFFREEGHSAAVRHCVIDRDLAAQLFARVRHERSRETPQKFVLAACWAAEAFPAAVWASHVNHVERLDEEEATAADLARVMRTGQIRAAAEEEAAEPAAADPAAAAADEARCEYDRLERLVAERRAELAALTDSVAVARAAAEPAHASEPAGEPAPHSGSGEERDPATELKQTKEELERLRRAASWLAVLIVAGVLAVLGVAGVLSSATSWFIALPASIAAAVMALAWGYRMGPVTAFGLVGAICGVIGVYEIPPKDSWPPARTSTTPAQTVTAPPRPEAPRRNQGGPGRREAGRAGITAAGGETGPHRYSLLVGEWSCCSAGGR